MRNNWPKLPENFKINLHIICKPSPIRCKYTFDTQHNNTSEIYNDIFPISSRATCYSPAHNTVFHNCPFLRSSCCRIVLSFRENQRLGLDHKNLVTFRKTTAYFSVVFLLNVFLNGCRHSYSGLPETKTLVFKCNCKYNASLATCQNKTASICNILSITRRHDVTSFYTC